MQKMKKLLAVLMALTVTAGITSCGGSENSTPEATTAPVASETAVQTTAAESTSAQSETAASTAAESTSAAESSAASAETTTAATTTATTASSTTVITTTSLSKAATTTTAAASLTTTAATTSTAKTTTEKQALFGLPMDISNPFRDQKEIAITGKGYAHATNGLRLRQKPSLKGKQIGTIKAGTTVDIVALAVSGDLYDWKGNNTRWYRVKSGSQEGYVSADYLAATFSQKPGELSALQLSGMTSFLFCQHFDLYYLLLFEGGFRGSADEKDAIEVDWGEYHHITPDSLTLDSLLGDFYKYFSKPTYSDRVKSFYKTENGKLYAAAPYIELMNLQTQSAAEITAVSDAEIQVKAIRGFSSEGESYQDDVEFALCYEDGCWKVCKCCSIYADKIGG